MNRPAGVTVIAVLEFLGAATCILLGLGAMLGGGFLATIMTQSGAKAVWPEPGSWELSVRVWA